MFLNFYTNRTLYGWVSYVRWQWLNIIIQDINAIFEWKSSSEFFTILNIEQYIDVVFANLDYFEDTIVESSTTVKLFVTYR